MRRWKLIAAALVVFTAGCGSSNKTVITVQVFPSTATVVLGGTQLFTATVQGSSNTSVNWSVSGSGCTATMSNPNPCGTIDSSTGLYHAPTSLPSAPTVTVTATSQAASSAAGSATVTLDSGIRVSLSPSSGVVGTGEFLQITPTVTGLTGGASAALTWMVSNISNGNTTVGQICTNSSGSCTPPPTPPPPTTCMPPSVCTVFYFAPATVPSPASIIIQATSVVDPNQVARATVTLANAVDPTLSSITPTTAAAGSVFQDVYLTGINFFSTSTVLINSTALPTTSTTFLSTTLLRIRVPGSMLQSTGSQNNLSVVVQRQSPPDTSSAQMLTVTPVRPAIVGTVPDSTPQGSAPPVSLDGGYYSPVSTSGTATRFEFNGQPLQDPQFVSPRQLNVPIPATATTSAGLFPLVLHNSGAAQPVNGVNLAIQPPAPTTCAPPPPPAPPVCTPVAVGSSPSAVAIDTALGKAVVTNQGDGTVSVIDMASRVVTAVVTVESSPTGVAVDNVRHIALVVNNGSGSANVSIVNLAANPPAATGTISGVGTAPFAAGINPLTGHGIVVDQSTNSASVIDLTVVPPAVVGTAAISTGPNPAVAIEPRLDWAIVTPGGLGSLSIVDLSHSKVDSSGNRTFSIVATLGITGSTQGIGLNTETDQVLLTDPSHTVATVFSLLDQTTQTVTLGPNQVAAAAVAAAVNPLTNIGVTVKNLNSTASIINLGTPAQLATFTVGTNANPAVAPVAVAIDPTTDIAVVANQGSNNVTLISLGALNPLQVAAISPTATPTSASDLTLTVIGNGFTANSRVRLDKTTILTPNSQTARQLTVTVPMSMLAGPIRYLVDVQDGTNVSNLTELTVIQVVPSCVPTSTAPCIGTAPQGVAIGHITVSGVAHRVAVVTNTGSSMVPGTTVSVIDLANPASCPIASIGSQCTIAVGTSPQGVAILERANRAVVTNFSDNTATIVDLTTGTAAPPVAVGSGPIGVAINPDTGIAVVANSSSNSLSLFSVDTGAAMGTVAVDQRPVAVAINPTRNLAAVANATQNTVDLVDLSSRLIVGRVGPPAVNLQIPSGVAFDPVSDVFVVANSLLNNLDIVDPATLLVTPLGIGINPTSLAYNFQSSTLVTVNTASNTASVVDLLSRRVRAVLSMNGSPQSAVAVDPQSNLAAIVDQANNQLLLVPLPR